MRPTHVVFQNAMSFSKGNIFNQSGE